MGGLVVTEQVFNLNGLGLLFVQAVAHRDYTLTQALVLLVAAALHRRQLLGRPRVRLDRPADPVPLTWRSTRRSTVLARLPRAAEPPPVARDRGRASSVAPRPLGAHRGRGHRPDGWWSPSSRRCWRRYDPLANDFGAMLSPPSAQHWLGTDALRARRALAPDLRLAHGAAGGLRRLGARRHRWAPSWASPAPTSAGGSTSILQRRHGHLPVVPADHPGPGGGGDPGQPAAERHRWPSRSR